MILTFIKLNILCLGIFTIIYHLVYRNSSQFTANRFYLLISAGLCICIPFIHFDVFPEFIKIQQRQSIGFGSLEGIPATKQLVPELNPILKWYGIGVILYLSILIFKMALIFNRIMKATGVHFKNFILIKDQITASFFNYIFLEDDDPIKLNHEIQHSRRHHSIDRMLFELMLCLAWFNPFMYIYRYLIIENHEYEADHLTINSLQLKKAEYGAAMLNSIKKAVYEINMSNSFHSLTKNRIKMLSNQTSRKLATYFMIPLGFLIFSAFTFKSYPVYVDINENVIPDTIPENIKIIDTIAVFDPSTGNESIRVVEHEKPVEEYLEELDLKNGEYSYVTDTVSSFSTEHYKEEISIEKLRYPAQLNSILNSLSEFQKYQVINRYSEKQTIKASLLKNSAIRLFPSNETYTLSIYQKDTPVNSIEVSPNTQTMDLRMLNMEKGAYKIYRSDTNEEIDITII